tara:strand:- start:7087 stop:7506 length:420 start_codon:yes stop_codon:yes gene_type:complete
MNKPDPVRSKIMSCIKSKNTKPEVNMRKLLHGLGFRFSLHRKDLPGKPDIVMPKYNTCIFVNGCFWHKHNCKRGRKVPKTNTEFWLNKFTANRKRDARNRRDLRKLGWEVETVWECHVNKPEKLEKVINKLFQKRFTIT